MNKQRKLLISVLGLGLGALALDKFVLAPPQSASADQLINPDAVQADPLDPAMPDAGALQPAAPERGGGDAPQSLPSFASLTERLIEQQGALPDPQAEYDPFKEPGDWQRQIEQLHQDAPDSTKPAAALRSQYRLDGTFRSVDQNREEELIAVMSSGNVNGQAMRVGQYIKVELPRSSAASAPVFELFKLVEVGAHYAIWQSDKTGERVLMQSEALPK